ncbi:hypothetical protein [Paractinoplanes abujensis]|uniref:hypothetical protein n=1 Tax=Paractinoplanes abujensis TaxID=882441 RepID=UPI001944A00C|nr:hypothetical protein [Actinoplanes abujensis]
MSSTDENTFRAGAATGRYPSASTCGDMYGNKRSWFAPSHEVEQSDVATPVARRAGSGALEARSLSIGKLYRPLREHVLDARPMVILVSFCESEAFRRFRIGGEEP